MPTEHLAVAVAAAGAAFTAALSLWALARATRRAVRSARARRRAARSLRGERRAERLLAARGFEVSERQVRTAWAVQVDGDEHPVDLRADLIACRDGRRYVAEVKTGDEAPRLTTAATRRQLLEYRVAYDVDGVLLVDVEAGAIAEVAFPIAGSPPRSRRRAHALVIAAALGAALGAGATAALTAGATWSPPAPGPAPGPDTG